MRAFRIGLVVLLDVIEVVEIVHHQSIRLRDGAFGCVGKPVDAFEPRAVAKMESRDRIDRACRACCAHAGSTTLRPASAAPRAG